MQPHVRGGVLENFRTTVESLGQVPDLMLEKAGVHADVLKIAGTYLPYSKYMLLLSIAAEHTDCPRFGLEMTRVASAETLGVLGFLMTQSGTVADAWRTLSRMFPAHDTYGTVGYHQYPTRISMTYSIPESGTPGCDQIYDVAAGITTNIMRQFCGAGWRALELGFPYRQPKELSAYEPLGAQNLLFDHHCYELFFDTTWAEKEISYGVPEMNTVLKTYFSPLLPTAEQGSRHAVEDLIRTLLPTGECNIRKIAAVMNASVRTLQQRLEREQCSYEQLLEKVRREIALHHLRRGDMQLTQLAIILGYSELSAFSRSFRRWYGTPPSVWASQNS